VAFVGPSGAGKSTTFQLLLRFYDPDAGRVCIDGIQLTDLKPEDVRRSIGMVPQETVLFGASARENIRYGRPTATDTEVEAAAVAAAADEFLRKLPQGYDTFLGERGTRLSGGQRQRIALARALVRRPSILVLDEATSDLDSVTEAQVIANLSSLECTRIVIAHRISTIESADVIIVMEHGAIVQQGTSAELMRQNGLYRTLVTMQSGSSLQSQR
jgi:ATP-binding cassette subfamily B protein